MFIYNKGMRKIDENKKLAITKAVFELTQEVGLSGLSVAKVAKLAGVSPATIYIYYQDKADMLSQILMAVKDLIDQGQEEACASTENPVEQLRRLLRALAHQCVEHPTEAVFMRAALQNPTEIGAEGLAYSEQQAKYFIAVYERLLETKKIKNYPIEFLLNWSTNAMASLLYEQFLAGKKTTDLEIEQMIELSLDAILLR